MNFIRITFSLIETVMRWINELFFVLDAFTLMNFDSVHFWWDDQGHWRENHDSDKQKSSNQHQSTSLIHLYISVSDTQVTDIVWFNQKFKCERAQNEEEFYLWQICTRETRLIKFPFRPRLFSLPPLRSALLSSLTSRRVVSTRNRHDKEEVKNPLKNLNFLHSSPLSSSSSSYSLTFYDRQVSRSF